MAPHHQRIDACRRLGHYVGEDHALHLEFNPVADNSRKIENVIQQAAQVSDLPVNDFNRSQRIGIAVIQELQDFKGIVNGGQWVPQIVGEFGGLDELLAATDADLEAVEGVGEIRAKDIREGLRRLQELNLVDRYLQT